MIRRPSFAHAQDRVVAPASMRRPFALQVPAAQEPAMIEPSFLWTRLKTTGAVPPHTCCHTACLYKDRYVITFGGGGRVPGEQQLQCFNTVSCFDLETCVWHHIETKNSEIVYPRTAHSAVIYGDKMLVYGGHPLHSQPLLFSGLLELDLVTWTWRLIHEVPSAPEGPGERYMHTATVWNDRMYVVMGVGEVVASLMWYLDLKTYTWHQVAKSSSFCAPQLPLYGHNTCLEGDYLYIFGGESRSLIPSSRTGGYEHEAYSYTNTLYRYHLPTNAWSISASVGRSRPRGRYASAMGILDGHLYLFGGDCDGSRVYFDDFWTFDVNSAEGNWQEIGTRMKHGPVDRQRPSKRTGMPGVIAKGSFYLFGGEVAPKDPNEDDDMYTNEVFRCPLSLSLDAPLEDSLARWLSRCSANTMTAATFYPTLPLAARRLLGSYLPNSEVFFSAALEELSSTTGSSATFNSAHSEEEGNEDGDGHREKPKPTETTQ